MWRRSSARREKGFLVGGWLVLVLALVSPLCNLSVALFSAKASQHLILAYVAAPLLVLGGTGELFRFWKPLRNAWLNAGVFAAVFWFWHVGYPYDLTLKNNAVYWSMQISVICAALSLWQTLLRDEASTTLAFVTVSVATGGQMTLLGALLTLSSTPWFQAHEFTTWPWGLTPLQDQQLGGVLMWIVGGILLTGFTVYGLARLLQRLERVSAMPVPRS
jgi:putative membrane protein